MPWPNDRDRAILGVLSDGRANPRYLREQTGYDKYQVNSSLVKLEKWGFVSKLTRGLYEITDEGRAALESE